MTWAVFLDSDGKPRVELYAFCRGKPVLWEYQTKPEADRALKAYLDTREDEIREDSSQRRLW